MTPGIQFFDLPSPLAEYVRGLGGSYYSPDLECIAANLCEVKSSARGHLYSIGVHHYQGQEEINQMLS